MEIIRIAPVIFTKDEEWLRDYEIAASLEPGSIVVLPEDAVLYIPEEK